MLFPNIAANMENETGNKFGLPMTIFIILFLVKLYTNHNVV
jgi:hypothetical protein